MPTAHEHFSEQFQKWEVRGRGWQVFAEPVYPEPPFVPLQFRSMVETLAVDDGRRHTFLSGMMQKLSRSLSSVPPPSEVEPEPDDEPEPIPLIRDSLVELQVSLPADLDIARESFDQLFRNLALCREPVVFELLGSHRRVLAQFVTGTDDASLVRKQLQAHFPNVQFRQQSGTLEKAWTTSNGNEAFAVEFGLEHEFMLPLACGKLDPFIGIVAAMAELRPGELGLFQVIFQPVQNPWAESIVNSVTYEGGKPLWVNSPELASAAENKAAQPLFGVVVRIMARAAARPRLYEIARDLAGSLRVFANPQGNALIPLKNDDYPYIEHLADVVARQSRRSGMILNSDELVNFVHLPSSAVRSPVLQRDTGRTKTVPGIVRRPPGVVIGDNEHNDVTVPVYLTADQRVRHTHIIGSSGTGKSSLLFNLIQQDIENGEGVAVLDPHGDLINQILGIIPDNRIDDVVLVDPSDVNFPIGFNILQAHSDDEKTLLASDLIAVFRRLATSWGDQMDTVLQNAILAILESEQGGTLSDLRLFLLDDKYRKQFLQTVSDPEIIFYWQKVFPQLTGGKSIGPVLTRLQDFFSRKPLRNMVGQQQNKLDFADIMDSGKIFLARLPEGCGEENSYLLGSLMVSKFQQLAMARQSQQVALRKQFWLYIDEFDHFITPSMAKILTSTRKYGLGFTLAHQELHQLQSDPKVASAVMTQPCTRIVFKVGDDDAKKLGDGFESFDAKSLKTLEKFHAIVRVERNDFDFNLTLRKPELPDEAEAQSQRDKIIAASRAKYATPRAEVEADLLARIWGDKPQSPQADGTGGKPTPKPVSPSGAPSNLSTTPPTGAAKVATPSLTPVISQSAEPSPIAEPPAVAEITFVAAENPSHTAIKNTIGSEAESLDYAVSYEEHFPVIQARADVVLRRGSQTIVCQVSATTPPEFEAESVRKFLKLSFTHIAVISINRRKLGHIQEALGRTGGENIGYYSPEEFISMLHNWAMEDPGGAAIEKSKPRKRQIQFGNIQLNDEERRQLESELLKSLAQAMKSK